MIRHAIAAIAFAALVPAGAQAQSAEAQSAAAPAATANPYSCPPPDGITAASYPNDLPDGIVALLNNRLGTFATADQNFQAGDVATGQPTIRLDQIWHKGPHWAFIYEHGGRGYSVRLMAYDLGEDGQPNWVMEAPAPMNRVCAWAKDQVSHNGW